MNYRATIEKMNFKEIRKEEKRLELKTNMVKTLIKQRIDLAENLWRNKKMKQKKPKIISQRRVKYICGRCGHIQKKTLKEKISGTILFIILIAGIITLSLTIILLADNQPSNMLVSYIELIRYKEAYKENQEIRESMIPQLNNCSGDEDCIIINTANHLEKTIRYTPSGFGKVYNPSTTIRTKAGECEEMSVLVVNALRQFNIESYVDCNDEYNHCVATAYPEDKPYYYWIDLTQTEGLHIARLDKGLDHWEFYEKNRLTLPEYLILK